MRRTCQPQSLFVLLLLIYTFCAVQIAFCLPAFASPNEGLHYEYVVLLRKTGRLPDLNQSARADEREQPPLYYGLAALFGLPFSTLPLDTELATNPYFLATHQGNLNPVVPLLPEQLPMLYVARLVSTLIGLVALIGVYVGACRILPKGLALLITSLIAFQPMFLFLSGTVNNDLAVSACAAWVVTWCSVFLIEQSKPRRYLRLGLLLGVALLAKANAIFLLLLLPVVCYFDWRRTRNWQSTIGLAGWVVGGFLPIWGSWLLTNYWRSQDVLGISHSITISDLFALHLRDLQMISAHYGLLLRSFWFDWSVGDTGFAPTWLYGISALWLLLAITGWLRIGSTPHLSAIGLPVFLLHTFWAIFLVALFLLTRIITIKTYGVLVPEGRWMLPIVPSLAWVSACGWSSWWPKRYLETACKITAFLPPILLVFFAFVWLPQHYPQAQRLASVDDAQLTPLDQPILYENELLLHAIKTQPFYNGQPSTVTLAWEALRKIQEDYTVSVQLLIPTTPSWTTSEQQNSYPGNGLSPTSHWQAGEIYADSYQLIPNSPLAGPTRGLLAVWVLQGTGENKRTLKTSRNETLYDPPVVTEVVIRPSQAFTINQQSQLSLPVNFADLFELEAVEWQPPHLVLWWKALAPTSVDYTIFVHLLTANGQTVAQYDAPPNQGLSPTTIWAKGDIIRDERVFDQQVPNQSSLAIGAYDRSTMIRLPARQGENALPENTFQFSLN